jgi:hypothetical protein
MGKRSKKNRRTKAPVARPAAKEKTAWWAGVFVVTALVLAFSFWQWRLRSPELPTAAPPNSEARAANPTTADGNFDFQKLKGRWQRPDGGYVLEVKSIAPDGSMDAGYFNPRSIHVARAEASRDGVEMKIFIELREVNYPGSTYTPSYELASDQLKGIYTRPSRASASKWRLRG